MTESVTPNGAIRHFRARLGPRAPTRARKSGRKSPNSGSGFDAPLPIGGGAAERLARALLIPVLATGDRVRITSPMDGRLKQQGWLVSADR